MDNEVINKLLSVDLKVATNKNKEATVRLTDFKNCKDANISYDYYEFCDSCCLSPTVLKEIKITIPCNGYSLEIFNK